MSEQNFGSRNKFEIIISRKEVKTLEFFVKNLTIGGIGIGSVMQPTPITQIPIVGDSFYIDDLAITFYIDEGWNALAEILKWMKNLKNGEDMEQNYDDLADISIRVLNSKYKSNKIIVYKDCFPFNIASFDQDVEDDGMPLQMMVIFKSRDFEIIEES